MKIESNEFEKIAKKHREKLWKLEIPFIIVCGVLYFLITPKVAITFLIIFFTIFIISDISYWRGFQTADEYEKNNEDN